MLWLLSLQCSLQDCIVAGTDVGGAIRVMHEDTKATFGKCMFERAHGPLATVMEGAFAEFLDCKLAESVAAVGVEVAGGGSRMEAERCSIDRCHGCALHIHSGALLLRSSGPRMLAVHGR